MPMSDEARERKRVRDRAHKAYVKAMKANTENQEIKPMASNVDMITEAIRKDGLTGSPSAILLTMGIVDNDEYSQLREIMRVDGAVEFEELPNTAYIPRSVSFPDFGHENKVTWELVRADGYVVANEVFNHYARVEQVTLCP